MSFHHPHEREQALRWLIRNRRADVSVEQAVRVMLLALPRDMATMQLLQRLRREEEDRVDAARPNRSCPPGVIPRR